MRGGSFYYCLEVMLEAWRKEWPIAATLDSKGVESLRSEACPEMMQSDRPKEKKTKCAMNASARVVATRLT
ncbi:protein of unknown function [Pseudomonas sp. JV551A1]|uniref:Uncharacterized protein n=1 Tax=Pseudomonas inefficax TaxID=2078786 RepID=A0AAQ1P5B8_9PSED|nr:protein of unknown function [Pseudomonas sp. JV551A1]SPO60171.1 protein of unknown function [Pseudomonas inefficax]